MKLSVCVWVTQSCPILCNPMEYSPLRLLLPNFPGKKTGLHCHFLPQRIFWTRPETASPASPASAGGFFTSWATAITVSHEDQQSSEGQNGKCRWSVMEKHDLLILLKSSLDKELYNLMMLKVARASRVLQDIAFSLTAGVKLFSLL